MIVRPGAATLGAAQAEPSGPGRPPADLCRSWLLFPATRITELSEKHHVADALVLDLEDGVAEGRKTTARDAVAEFLADREAWVRINDAATAHWFDDLTAIAGLPGLQGVVLAKAESPDDVRRTAELLPPGTLIVPMIETAASLLRVDGIAAEPSTFRLAFGVGDFRSDTGIGEDPLALAYARSRLVIASAAAGIPAPIDGPSRCGVAEVAARVGHGRAMGMRAALVLDPTNLDEVHRALSPTDDEIVVARALLELPVRGDADGSYLPAVKRARRVLALAEAYGR
ncbi:HpcH/HpaI aldolase/citrate lyase family protein [Amnibacterium flavum]|uniref:CoA ester lyase n=1 Tax=Amnibacterium flavum TaxID=2173173 RepID=A0A2V1HSE3_9MICO|nr:aldolase/citrate lyase family protein [Amnibacterium flavum]PVZ93870.1 CoA ester lyase [Amnibacterium flavum]